MPRPPIEATIEGIGPVQEVGRRQRRERESDPLFSIRAVDPGDEQKIVTYGDQLFEISHRNRRQLLGSWVEFYNWARGYHWDDKRPKWRSQVQANYIFSNIFTKAALLTDSRPELKAMPRHPEQALSVVKSINPYLYYQWDQTDMHENYPEMAIGLMIYGTYFLKPYWDPSAWEGEGDIKASIVSPFFVFPDPGASGHKGSEFVFHAEPMSLSEINLLWPERGPMVEPEDVRVDYFGITAADRKGPEMPPDRKPWFMSMPIIGGLRHRQGSQSPEATADIDRAVVKELWIRDDRVVETEDGIKLAYPFGRQIVYANGVLLTPDEESQQSPYANGRFPLIRMRDYVWPDEYWGGGEVEQVIPLQREMNLLRARMSDHFNNFVNGKWIVDRESQVNLETLSNNPAQVIVKKRGTEVRRDSGLPLPSGMIEVQRDTKFDFENIAGNTDVNQGRVPDRISSGLAIQEVKEAAQARIRLTERFVREGLKEFAEFVVELGAQHYSDKRILRIVGEDGQPSFTKIGPKQLAQKYDYEANVGSQILHGRQRLTVNDAVALFNIGMIDQQALLEAIDFPEYKSLMARMKSDKAKLIQMLKTDPEFARVVMESVQEQQQPSGPTGLVAGGM